jgi:hypothetical protein
MVITIDTSLFLSHSIPGKYPMLGMQMRKN